MHRLLRATLATVALAGLFLLLLSVPRADNLLVALVLAGLGGGTAMAWFRFLWGLYLAPDRKTGGRG